MFGNVAQQALAPGRPFDVARNGRFLVLRDVAPPTASTSIVVVLDWIADLRK